MVDADVEKTAKACLLSLTSTWSARPSVVRGWNQEPGAVCGVRQKSPGSGLLQIEIQLHNFCISMLQNLTAAVLTHYYSNHSSVPVRQSDFTHCASNV